MLSSQTEKWEHSLLKDVPFLVPVVLSFQFVVWMVSFCYSITLINYISCTKCPYHLPPSDSCRYVSNAIISSMSHNPPNAWCKCASAFKIILFISLGLNASFCYIITDIAVLSSNFVDSAFFIIHFNAVFRDFYHSYNIVRQL